MDLGERAAFMSARPRILDLVYLGQSPKSLQVLLFEIAFDDADGDLGQGFVDVFISGGTTPMPMHFFLLQAGVSSKAKFGRFVLPVQIEFQGQGQSFATRFEIGFQLRDALGHKSNLARARLTAEIF